MKDFHGIHVVGSLNGCPVELLKEVDTVKSLLNKVVHDSNFNKVGEVFHQFKPYGVTGVILIAESHISVHTWPEKNFVAVDVFTCGKEGDAEKAFDLLVKEFKARDFEKTVVKR